MRRKIALLMAVLCVLCGCTAQENVEAQKQTALTVVLWDYDKTSYDSRLVQAFEESHPEVRVNIVSYPDAYYDQKMQARLLGGRQTDVFLCRTIGSLHQLYEYGIAQPLDSLMEQYGHDLQGEQLLEQMRFDGEQYGVPYRTDHYVLLYNCDLFDKAGIPYPKQQMTWEQVYALAQQLQQGLSADEYAMMALPMDIQWLAAGRNGDYSSAENIRQISEWMVCMQQAHCMPQYSDAIARDIQQQCFELGKYGMYIGGTWYLNYLRTDAAAGRFHFHWGVVEVPAWADGQRSSEPVVQTGMGICRASQQQELAWEFIQFAAGAEGARIMASEQMLPAYMDSTVETAYQSSFQGEYLDPAIYKGRKNHVSAYRDDSREREILCAAFRQSVTRQKDIDTALRNAQREIEALSS